MVDTGNNSLHAILFLYDISDVQKMGVRPGSCHIFNERDADLRNSFPGNNYMSRTGDASKHDRSYAEHYKEEGYK